MLQLVVTRQTDQFDFKRSIVLVTSRQAEAYRTALFVMQILERQQSPDSADSGAKLTI
jgi:hypothetical protein